jgi:hypothetical protein
MRNAAQDNHAPAFRQTLVNKIEGAREAAESRLSLLRRQKAAGFHRPLSMDDSASEA